MQVRNYMTGAAAVTHPDEPVVAAARLMRMRSIMSRDPVTVEAGADIRRAMETMRAAQVRRLPVTEGGKLAGILSIDDIARSGKWDMECAQALCGITANVCRR